VGSWNLKAWQLSQDINGDGKPESSSLLFANDYYKTDEDGNAVSVNVDAPVYYTSDCQSPVSEYRTARLKLFYDYAKGTSSLQLFVAYKAGAEIPREGDGLPHKFLSTGHHISRCMSWSGGSSCVLQIRRAQLAVKGHDGMHCD
jgi:hypothetical protein